MISRNDEVRLRHMLEAAQKAVALVGGRNRPEVEADERNVMSLIRLLEILGEAARQISPAFRDGHAEIPWQQIANHWNMKSADPRLRGC